LEYVLVIHGIALNNSQNKHKLKVIVESGEIAIDSIFVGK